VPQHERLVDYLLGELSEEQRDQLEAEYLVNGELHDELVAIEDELIYAYVAGRLSASQSAGFERFFLQTPERRSRIEFARSFAPFFESNLGREKRTVPSLQNERSSEALANLVSGQQQELCPDDRLGTSPKWISFWTNVVARLNRLRKK
jgi:hypothetical protein